MAFKTGRKVFALLITLLLLFGGVYSVSAPSSPARIVNGLFSNAFSLLMKWISSLKTTTKTATTGRPLMKFEGGYNVETVFDGSKLGIEPYSVEVLPDGDLLILDSANSNLYKISSSLSLYSRPRLVSGSADGYSGHVDGRLREARMNHPKGVTVDDRGNIYIADTDNMAIRKISDTGVTTIAGGGKRSRGGGHVDGPSEDAKFSNDFDVVYLGSSCSLLVIDRGNKAIREIQLNFDDCAYQYGSGFPLGMAVLVIAGFFGYMLALLQRRDYGETRKERGKPLKSWMIKDDEEKEDESFSVSLTRLMSQTLESVVEIVSGFFPILKKKAVAVAANHHQDKQQMKYSNAWPVQESFIIADGDEPPPGIETRTPTPTPTPKKTYAFMANDSEKMQQLKQSRAFYTEWEQSKKHQNQQLQYEEGSDEIVFGAIQEQYQYMEGKSNRTGR